MTRLNDFDQFTEWLDNLPENPKLIKKIELMADFYKDFDLYYNRFGEKLIQNIYKKNPPDMFSAIYAINKILLSIGEPYISILSDFIVEAFVTVVKNITDPKTINKLVKIRNGWSQVFPEDVLSILDYELFKIDSLWPGIGNDCLQRSTKCQYQRPLNAKRKPRTEKINIMSKQTNHNMLKSKNENIYPRNMKSLVQEKFNESNDIISLQNQFKSTNLQMSQLSIDVSKNQAQEPLQNSQNIVVSLYSQNNLNNQMPFETHLNLNEPMYQSIQLHYDDQKSTQKHQMTRVDKRAQVKSNKIQRQQNIPKSSDISLHLNKHKNSQVPILPKYISSKKPLSTINICNNIQNNFTDQQNNSMFSFERNSKFDKPTEIYPNSSRICISGPAFDLFPEESNEKAINSYTLNKDSDYDFTAEKTHSYEEYIPESDEYFVTDYIPFEKTDFKDKNDLDNYSFPTFSKFNENAAKKLYQGSPCSICYKRFQINKKADFEKHQDFHYKKSQTMHIVRKYTPHYSQWIENSKGKDSRVPLKSDKITKHTLQVFDDYDRNRCGMCNDRFDIQFDKNEDCYMLQNAVLFNDNPYHPICINMT